MYYGKKKTEQEARGECMALLEAPLAIKGCVEQLLANVEIRLLMVGCLQYGKKHTELDLVQPSSTAYCIYHQSAV